MVVPGPDNPGDPIQYDVNNIYDEVVEIDTHLHSPERWLGAKAVPTATVFAEANETSYQIDSGNTVFGAWLQILGTDDTPVIADKAYFDFHRVLITDVEETTTYRIQFAHGADADVAVAAGDYTEVIIKFGVGQVKPTPFDVQNERLAAGEEVRAVALAVANEDGGHVVFCQHLLPPFPQSFWA